MTETDCLLAPLDQLDFHHSLSIPLPEEMGALQAWNLVMSQPLPLIGLAFRLRDAVSARFGVRRIGGFTGQRRETVAVGEHLDFFLVERADPDLLLLTERDRHLDVMTAVSTRRQRLTIISSVITHNLFGRIYMSPVGVAHRIIVGAMLRRLARRLDAGAKVAQVRQ